MSAQSIGIFTIDFPDPYMINFANNNFDTLPPNGSFQFPITNNIQTLSSKNVERGNDPYGILFVPALSSDECKEAERAYVPSNVTRLAQLPPETDYALIAYAPWFNATCMTQYFQSARASPVKAFLVYQPGTTNEMPPVMNDPSWYLGDGGSWKMDNKFPTYALSSSSGGIITEQLSLYSGNITDVPNGHDLAEQYPPTDYVRLWATVTTDPQSQLPSLWVFLVIVLGLLIFVIGSTSLMMHLVQRRRRNNLRQRVINGEVDLEALGVKRLSVPREYLEKLPLYSYSAEPEEAEKTFPQPPTQAHNIPSPTIHHTETGFNPAALTRRSSAPAAADNTAPSPTLSQPTCPICLDDFEPNESQVRELPCRHIFHADCIDPFLLGNSSLCPMCKKSVLPSGYCPARITNVMVRRERIIRRMRARRDGEELPPSGLVNRLPIAYASLRSRVGGASGGRRIFSAPGRTSTREPDVEMTGANPAPAVSDAAGIPAAAAAAAPGQQPSPRLAAPSTQADGIEECSGSAAAQAPSSLPAAASQNRREWARQRAMALLGNNRNVPSEVEDEENRGPRWKRELKKVFPGFR